MNHQNGCRCSMCDGGKSPSQIIADAREMIRQHGFQITAVFPDRKDTPGFAYTAGLLTTYGHPELAVYGLDPRTAHHVLHGAVELIKAGKTLVPGELYEVLEGVKMTFKSIPGEVTAEHFTIAYRVQPDLGVRFVQLVWPDEAGLFPWDTNFNRKYEGMQPMLWLMH